MKGGKYNKTAQESSSAAMRSIRNIQRSTTELLGQTACMGIVGCTLANNVKYAEYEMPHVIAT